MKTKFTVESVLKAIDDGAKSLTGIAHAHGYKGSVSGSTATVIRYLVPDVADRLNGKGAVQAVEAVEAVDEVEVVAAVPTEQDVVRDEPVAEAVENHDQVVEQSEQSAVQELTVEEPKTVETTEQADEQADEPVVVVKQTKKPYSGGVYGKVFEAALAVAAEQGEQPRKTLVEVVASKTGLDPKQIGFALQVFTTPKHQSNQNRSRNAAQKRGNVLLVSAL